jgi:hypothetical protein
MQTDDNKKADMHSMSFNSELNEYRPAGHTNSEVTGPAKGGMNGHYSKYWDDDENAAIIIDAAHEVFTKDSMIAFADASLYAQVSFKVKSSSTLTISPSLIKSVVDEFLSEHSRHELYYERHPNAKRFASIYYEAYFAAQLEAYNELKKAKNHVQNNKYMFILERRFRKEFGTMNDVKILQELEGDMIVANNNIQINVNMPESVKGINTEEEMLAESEKMAMQGLAILRKANNNKLK